MKSPKDIKVIQIEITNACTHVCANCMHFCGHHKKAYFMDYELFTKAVDSMEGFTGIIGIMGEEPTLHPEFERLVIYYVEHFVVDDNSKTMKQPLKNFIGEIIVNHFDINENNQRGLWASTGRKYYENFELI